MKLLPIIDRVLSAKELSAIEARALYERLPLPELGQLAQVRKNEIVPHPQLVTYILDRNVNYTNICNSDCIFCAFYRKPGHEEGYVLSDKELDEKMEATLRLGGNQILLQGGHNPELGIEYYERLFRRIKSRYGIRLHALSPSEIVHICETSNLTVEKTLERLVAAGLDSIPGGGAEILSDRVRKKLYRHKASTQEWLGVMEAAHKIGLKTTATMMFGHIETFEERLEHLQHLQNLQKKTRGFTAYIMWTFQKENTPLQKGNFFVSPNEYLRMLALSRIMLPDFVNIQVSFVTMGTETGTLGLHYGGNDYGSVMMEENVVKAAGADNPMTEADIRREIHSAGYIPRRRTMDYQLLPDPTESLDASPQSLGH